jgi:hypothetical protein
MPRAIRTGSAQTTLQAPGLNFYLANARVSKIGNAMPAMNETFTGTTTKERDVSAKARASTRVNSKSFSNEIDSQHKKHSEQKIGASQGIMIDLREGQK